MKEMRLSLEDELHALLLKKQRERKQHGLPHLNLQELAKMYMMEGLLQRHFLEQKEARS